MSISICKLQTPKILGCCKICAAAGGVIRSASSKSAPASPVSTTTPTDIDRRYSIRYFGDNWRNWKRKTPVLIRDTPKKLERKEPAPLYKYTDQFKEQALQNASEWLERDEHCELFGEEETKEYWDNYSKYKTDYLQCIQSIQQEVGTHNATSQQATTSASDAKENWFGSSAENLNEEWNSELKTERDKFIQSELSSRSEKVRRWKQLMEKENYISQLIHVKSERLANIVTEENIDEMISLALNSTACDFNFALDNEGTVHKGVAFDRENVRLLNESRSPSLTKGFFEKASFARGAAVEFEQEDDVLEDERVAGELGDIFGEDLSDMDSIQADLNVDNNDSNV